MSWQKSYPKRFPIGCLLLAGIALLFLEPSVRETVRKILVNGLVNLFRMLEMFKKKASGMKGTVQMGGIGIKLGRARESDAKESAWEGNEKEMAKKEMSFSTEGISNLFGDDHHKGEAGRERLEQNLKGNGQECEQ